MPNKLFINRIVFILITCSSLFIPAACEFKSVQQTGTPDDLLLLDSILKGSRSIDSLSVLAEIHIKTDNKTEAIKVFRRMGSLSRETDNYIQAIEYHNRALSIAEAIGDEIEIILCLNQIGTNYRRIGAYEEAATYHYRALQHCEQYSGKNSDFALKNKVISLNGIGNVYLTLGNLDEAYAVFRTALAGEIQLGSHLGMAINYANIGAIFENRAMYDSAMVYYKHSMEQNILAKSMLGISLCHNHFGRLAELKGNYDEALQEYHAAYDIMDKSTDRWHWMEACLSIVKVNIDKGDMKTAAEYLERAEKTAHGIRSKDYFSAVYEMKYNYYMKKGDFHRALNNYILSRQYADSTLNLKNVNHINNLRVRYEIENKELKIAVLEDEKRLMQWMAIAGGAILLLALTAFFFLWRWAVQKKQLAETHIKQLEQEKQLVATQSVLDGEARERARLARDLHDGLGSILTGARLNLLEIKKGTTSQCTDMERFDKVLRLLDQSVREMRRVAHHLMPDSLSRFGLKPAVDEFCRSLSSNVAFDYFGNEARLEPKLEVVIYRCIHELVNNALKHSGATQIMVQIMQEPNRIAFIVQDDGCGFDTLVATKGTGLENIRTRIASFGGNIQIDSVEGKGTEVNIEIQLRITN
ncbi:MAG: tetratricopeptide repeat protein [Prevotellaceae bacterium]|jgi:signal transduction histidine kinase|nr:tetratricopeptide repeat protein [Prevotellaceae bacterium]